MIGFWSSSHLGFVLVQFYLITQRQTVHCFRQLYFHFTKISNRYFFGFFYFDNICDINCKQFDVGIYFQLHSAKDTF